MPFDRQLRPGSAVFFRYGAFGHEEVEIDDGTRVSALRMPNGELVPDLREPGKAVPDWIDCPFQCACRSGVAADAAADALPLLRSLHAAWQGRRVSRRGYPVFAGPAVRGEGRSPPW
ncbi:hypothetical protein V8017_21490 [Stenotrophomonas rhizophila]